MYVDGEKKFKIKFWEFTSKNLEITAIREPLYLYQKNSCLCIQLQISADVSFWFGGGGGPY